MNWRIYFRDGSLYAALFVLCLLMSWGAYRVPLSHGEVMAAWFQGFGTVAAVCMTIAIGIRAENEDKRQRAEVLASFIEQIDNLAGSAQVLGRLMQETAVAEDIREFQAVLRSAEELRAQFAKWSELPISQWPSAPLSVAVGSLGRSFSALVADGETMASNAHHRALAERADTLLGKRLVVFDEHLARVSALAELVLTADTRRKVRARSRTCR